VYLATQGTRDIPFPLPVHTMPSIDLWLLRASIAHVAVALVARSSTSNIHSLQDGASRNVSALHDVVGPDGVLVIYLERAGRKEYERLREVGIYPTLVPAVDGKTASPDELREAGLTPSDKSDKCNWGRGNNRDPIAQAISASHRKAILAAKDRDYMWTAILEDDAVPIDPVNFNTDFRNIWSKIPEGTGIVRLNWCPLLSENKFSKHTYYTHGSMHIVDYQINYANGKYHVGGCTTAYMVHRDVIPRLLDMFPCCDAFDTCLLFQLYWLPKGCSSDNNTKCWGQENMVGIDSWGSASKTKDWVPWTQNGILAQDNRVSKSTKILQMAFNKSF